MAKTPELSPEPTTDRRATATTRPERPGATLVWVLLAATVLLFAARLTALRATAAPALDIQTVTALVVHALPAIVSAGLLVGVAAGLGAAAWRRRAGQSRAARLGIGAAAGLLAALVTGGALLVSGNTGASPVVTAAVTVALGALVGGLLSAVRLSVLAAGLSGALAVAVIQTLATLFTAPLRGLLDGSGTGPEVAEAVRVLAMIVGLAAGAAAGLVSYAVLRRLRPAGLAGHLAAGAAAGAFLLLAEVLIRVALPVLLAQAGGHSGDDPLVVRLTGDARLNSGLLVFFAGAITGLIALGRSLRGPKTATRSRRKAA